MMAPDRRTFVPHVVLVFQFKMILLFFQLVSLSLPSHWIKQFFIALVYLELQLNEEALKIYQDMEENGFHQSTYIVAHIASAYHNMRGGYSFSACLN